MVQVARSGLGSQTVTGLSWNQAGAAGYLDAEGRSRGLPASPPGCISVAASLSGRGNCPTELGRVQVLKPNHLSLNPVRHWLGDLRQVTEICELLPSFQDDDETTQKHGRHGWNKIRCVNHLA